MRTDRFQELPDSLLIHILSFLDVREAGITSVLSKRWKCLWSELPRLEFDNGVVGTEMDEVNFVSWVNRTIDIREGKYLEKFMVAFDYKENFASDVDAWVEFCVKSKVKQLILLLSTYWEYEYYTPPKVIYSCSSLTTLNLMGCIMAYEGAIAWKSLTDLTLFDVELNQQLLDEILTSCPVLNNLDLTSCTGFNRLEVNSRCLKSLTIEESEDEPIVVISVPYICSLDMKRLARGRKTLNISSVVTASIDLLEYYGDNSVEVMDNAKDFLENFKHVNDLHLHSNGFEVVSEMAVNGWRLPQFRLRHLEINSCSEYKFSISGIICLLESSPNLETLFLNGFRTWKSADLHPAAKSDLDGDLLHLREIVVCNFADPKGEPLLTLASILLRRAPALEEMVIEVNVSKTSEFIHIFQALLTYPRSSSKAQIHLSRE